MGQTVFPAHGLRISERDQLLQLPEIIAKRPGVIHCHLLLEAQSSQIDRATDTVWGQPDRDPGDSADHNWPSADESRPGHYKRWQN